MTDYSALLGISSRETISPVTPEAVAEVVGTANAAGQTVIPAGGNTAQGYGYAPASADIVLETQNLRRIIGIEAGDLTVSVQAGVTLSRLQNALAEKGLFLPVDAENPASATMGGIIATNATGAAQTGYGTVRDWLIGITVADTQGNLIKGGGNVVKNVTGYDIPKLHVGALGTLGIVVTANFKVAPLPESGESLLFNLPANADVSGFLNQLRQNTRPVVALVKTKNSINTLLLTFAGFHEAVAADSAMTQTIASAFGIGKPALATAEVAAHIMRPADTVYRIQLQGLPDSSYALFSEVLEKGYTEVRGHPFTGVVEIFADAATDFGVLHKSLTASAAAHNATFRVMTAPMAARNGDFNLWFPLPPSFPIMRRLKATFDPNRILNRGRFVGAL